MKKILLFLAVCVISACTPTPTKFGASGGTASPIIPASWTVPAWFIDPANSSTTASDNNNCTTSATACRTYQEIAVHRWGTFSPILQQPTTITLLSSLASDVDPIIATPFMANSSYLAIQGTAVATTSATFTLVAAKSRVAGANSLLIGSFSAGTPAAGVMVENTTHPSRAYVYTTAGGANWNITQPMVKQALPSTVSAPAEVDTWASGDTVLLSSPIVVNISIFEPIFADSNFVTSASGFLYNLTIQTAPGIGGTALIGPGVQVQECVATGNMDFVGYTAGQPNTQAIGKPALLNSMSRNAVTCGPGTGLNVKGGALTNTTSVFCILNLDGDVIMGGIGQLKGATGNWGFVYLDQNVQVNTSLQFASGAYGGHVIYGNATANMAVLNSSRMTMSGTFTAGWTAPALITPGILLNGASLGHSVFTLANVDTMCGGIATTVAKLDAASSATCATTGFGGTAYNPGGASAVSSASQ